MRTSDFNITCKILKCDVSWLLLHSIVQSENEQNRWKMNDNFENVWNPIFLTIEISSSRTMNEFFFKPNAPISRLSLNHNHYLGPPYYSYLKKPPHSPFFKWSGPPVLQCFIVQRNKPRQFHTCSMLHKSLL